MDQFCSYIYFETQNIYSFEGPNFLKIYLVIHVSYSGADNSLARPGREHANVSVRMALQEKRA